jgi:hypothetical protein
LGMLVRRPRSCHLIEDHNTSSTMLLKSCDASEGELGSHARRVLFVRHPSLNGFADPNSHTRRSSWLVAHVTSFPTWRRWRTLLWGHTARPTVWTSASVGSAIRRIPRLGRRRMAPRCSASASSQPNALAAGLRKRMQATANLFETDHVRRPRNVPKRFPFKWVERAGNPACRSPAFASSGLGPTRGFGSRGLNAGCWLTVRLPATER